MPVATSLEEELPAGVFSPTGPLIEPRSDYFALLMPDAQVLVFGGYDSFNPVQPSSEAWDPETGYGMGWWIDRVSGYISDGGAYGTVPWLDLEDGYGAYLVVEATSQTGNALADQLYDVVEAAVTGS